jgi:hypothetical protein
MKTNEWLYGQDVDVPEIPAYVITRRIELLKEHLEELLETSYKKREFSRVRDVLKAIDFWEDIRRRDK